MTTSCPRCVAGTETWRDDMSDLHRINGHQAINVDHAAMDALVDAGCSVTMIMALRCACMANHEQNEYFCASLTGLAAGYLFRARENAS